MTTIYILLPFFSVFRHVLYVRIYVCVFYIFASFLRRRCRLFVFYFFFILHPLISCLYVHLTYIYIYILVSSYTTEIRNHKPERNKKPLQFRNYGIRFRANQPRNGTVFCDYNMWYVRMATGYPKDVISTLPRFKLLTADNCFINCTPVD